MRKTCMTLTSAALLAATGALAQESAPTTQEFEVTITSTGLVGTTMPMGKGQAAWIREGFLVISDTDGPLAGLGARCLQMGLALDAGIERIVNTCVYQDADGNQLWERSEFSTEGNGAPYVGKGTWIGGTGRFEGASGEFTSDSTYIGSPQEGVFQTRDVQKGTLILPPS